MEHDVKIDGSWKPFLIQQHAYAGSPRHRIWFYFADNTGYIHELEIRPGRTKWSHYNKEQSLRFLKSLIGKNLT